MRASLSLLIAVAAIVALAGSAAASEGTSSRDVQAAVDSYMASAQSDASLVGGPGRAGYDAGFWSRGGDFALRINGTLQARYEAISWDSLEPGDGPFDPIGFGGGDRSGFSLPRALIKFSGTAPCCTRYYIELDFGHFGRQVFDPQIATVFPAGPNEALGPVPDRQSANFDNTREAWIEWGCTPSFNVRMGQVLIPTTRQLMTPPELQQFVDISYASSITGQWLPGYTDRPRDFGIWV